MDGQAYRAAIAAGAELLASDPEFAGLIAHGPDLVHIARVACPPIDPALLESLRAVLPPGIVVEFVSALLTKTQVATLAGMVSDARNEFESEGISLLSWGRSQGCQGQYHIRYATSGRGPSAPLAARFGCFGEGTVIFTETVDNRHQFVDWLP